MKKKYLIFAAAALTLAACSNDENMEMTDGPVAARITAGVSSPTTRAIGTNWSGTESSIESQTVARRVTSRLPMKTYISKMQERL